MNRIGKFYLEKEDVILSKYYALGIRRALVPEG